MSKKTRQFCFPIAVCLLGYMAHANAGTSDTNYPPGADIATSGRAGLWRNPADIRSRNLFYGPGGQQHEPRGTFTFTKEDRTGTSPKFYVRDQDGVTWKVKLGSEARPETAASRLVWAAGYFANEYYFVSNLRVLQMPPHLHRGQKYVTPDGSVHNARLKRYLDGAEQTGTWQWKQDPFSGTRELNGLRVLMALLSNWDLTDENNAVYAEQMEGRPGQIYLVSDLGSTFGAGKLTWPLGRARGNLGAYSHAGFVTKTSTDSVNFQNPACPSLFFLATPREFVRKLHLRWIGRRIPRSDARWIGAILAQLSPQQIRDAFRAAAYSSAEVEGFARVVESRIAQLDKL